MSRASLVEELKRVIDPKMDAESARAFYRTYFNQVAQVFDEAWNGRKYSIKTGLALRAFLRMAPEVMKRVKDGGADPADALAIRRLVEPWKERIGSRRFETEGEWLAKLAGGSRGTVDLLAGELLAALAT